MCVDQWSGYPLFRKLSSTTAASIIKTLSEWFNLLGWPRSIRSDGGPQFRSEFTEFCNRHHIRHEMPSPYNPRANGLAKSAVKTVKNMLKKCLEQEEVAERALYEWRNLPCERSFSSSQLLFGRRQRMFVPQPYSAYNQVSFEKAAQAKDKHFDAQGIRYDKDKVNLPVLSIGQPVRVQDEKTGQWQALATLVGAMPDGLSYIMDIGGLEQLRSRHMLRPDPASQVESERDGPELVNERDGPKVGVLPLQYTAPRRSQRLLDKNSEGNRLIPVQPCAKARQRKKNCRSSGDSRSSIGKEGPPQVESQSLSWQTRPLTSIQTASASSISSGPPSHQGPLSSLPWQSSGSWLPCVATSGSGTTGGVVSDTTNSLRQSQGGSSPEGSFQAGLNLCKPNQTRPLMFPQPYPDRVGTGFPVVAGQALPSSLQPFHSMPCQPYLPLPQEGRCRSGSNSLSRAFPLSTTSQLVCPLVGVGRQALCPTMLVQQSRVTETGSQRSGMSPSLSSSLAKPLRSPLSPSPFPFREGKDRQLGSRGVGKFPSLSQKEKLIPLTSGCAREGSAPSTNARPEALLQGVQDQRQS